MLGAGVPGLRTRPFGLGLLGVSWMRASEVKLNARTCDQYYEFWHLLICFSSIPSASAQGLRLATSVVRNRARIVYFSFKSGRWHFITINFCNLEGPLPAGSSRRTRCWSLTSSLRLPTSRSPPSLCIALRATRSLSGPSQQSWVAYS